MWHERAEKRRRGSGMSDNRKICIFTGHRVIPAADRKGLTTRLADAVEHVYTLGCTSFICGGAIGFDRMAADAVLDARRRHPEIELTIFVPCRDQDARWYEAERRHYARQLAAANHVEVLSERYYDGCMRVRNQAMADRADMCIAYVTSMHSGSAQTYHMVERKLGGDAFLFNLAN